MKPIINNKKSLATIRKVLRKNLTQQERMIWSRLRRRNTGYVFRRQFSVGDYILDFYCLQKNLAIEIDGSQHIESKADIARDEFLRSQGIKVLRFWNSEVNNNIDGVMERIWAELN